MQHIELAQNNFRVQVGLQTNFPIQTKPLEPLGGSLIKCMQFKLYLVNRELPPYLLDVNQQRLYPKFSFQVESPKLHTETEQFQQSTKIELVDA